MKRMIMLICILVCGCGVSIANVNLQVGEKPTSKPEATITKETNVKPSVTAEMSDSIKDNTVTP